MKCKEKNRFKIALLIENPPQIHKMDPVFRKILPRGARFLYFSFFSMKDSRNHLLIEGKWKEKRGEERERRRAIINRDGEGQ